LSSKNTHWKFHGPARAQQVRTFDRHTSQVLTRASLSRSYSILQRVLSSKSCAMQKYTAELFAPSATMRLFMTPRAPTCHTAPSWTGVVVANLPTVLSIAGGQDTVQLWISKMLSWTPTKLPQVPMRTTSRLSSTLASHHSIPTSTRDHILHHLHLLPRFRHHQSPAWTLAVLLMMTSASLAYSVMIFRLARTVASDSNHVNPIRERDKFLHTIRERWIHTLLLLHTHTHTHGCI